MLTLKHRALAIVAGGLSTLCAAYLLFGGIPTAQDLNNPKNAVSAVVLLISVAACHQFMAAVYRGQWLQVVPMAVLVFASTSIVVVGTAGRNSESIKAAEEAAQRSQAAYKTASKAVDDAVAFHKAAVELRKKAIDKANADVDRQKEIVAAACNKNPDLDRCRGAKVTLATFEGAAKRAAGDVTVVDLADAAVKQKQREADQAKPLPDTSPAKAFAVLLATLGLISNIDGAAGVVSAVMPYLQSLVIEFAAAWFLLIGFPPAKVEVLEPVKVAREAPAPVKAPIPLQSEPLRVSIPWQATQAASIALPAMFAQPMPVTWAEQPVAIAAPVAAPATVAADAEWSVGAYELLKLLRSAGREVGVSEAAASMGVSVGEASRRKDELVDLINQRREGRNLFLSLK